MGRRKKHAAAKAGGLSLADLAGMLREAEAAVAKKRARRDELQLELDALNAELATLEGGSVRRGWPARAAGTRKKAGRKAKTGAKAKRGGRGPRGEGESLVDYIRKALKAAGGPMQVADLRQAVLDAGYPTKSKTFGVIVSQRLAGMDDVVAVSRGVYQLGEAGANGKAKGGRRRKK